MVLLAVAGVLLLAMLASIFKIGDIESGLATRARTALDEEGYPALDLEVDGRDVTIRGIVSSEADRQAAIAAVEGVSGVRTVNELLRIATTTTTPDTESPNAASDPAARGLDAPCCT
jgi:hypothetical protein